MREFSRMSLAWSAGPRNHSKSTVLRTNRYSQECKKSAQELLIESKGQCFDLSTSRNSQSIERPGRLPTASTSSCLLPPSHTNLSHCHIPTFCMPTYHILTCHHIPTFCMPTYHILTCHHIPTFSMPTYHILTCHHIPTFRMPTYHIPTCHHIPTFRMPTYHILTCHHMGADRKCKSKNYERVCIS